MRISTNQIQQTMLGCLERNYASFGKLQQQLATAKRIQQPSDDPIGAVSLIGLKREQSSIAQYQKNISQVNTQLSQSETQIDTMTNMMMRLQELTQTAANGNYGLEERQGMAIEMRELQKGLINLANTKDENGSYIFSGSQVDLPPVAQNEAGEYVYQGDTYQREVSIANGVKTVCNDNVSDMFFSAGNFFQELDDFIGVLESDEGDISADAGGMLDSLQATQTNLSKVQSGIGARINMLDQVNNSHDDMLLFNKEVVNDIESLDYSVATLEMASVLLALEVTQQSFVKVNSLNLFNHL